MEDGKQERAVGSMRAWEVIVAVGFIAFGALVVWDSRRLGASWGSDGPQAGYFPFYIGMLICLSSIANLIAAFNPKIVGKPFVNWGQMKMVLTVMIPCVFFVVLIANPVLSLGIYVASIIFIAFFMRYLGKYSWPKIAGVSIFVMVAFFLMFEIWFKVPLPKGPIEALIGFR